MTHDPSDPRLTAYALGELDESEHAEIYRILVESPECRQYVAEVRSVAAMLESSLRTEMTEVPVNGFASGRFPNLESVLNGAIAVTTSATDHSTHPSLTTPLPRPIAADGQDPPAFPLTPAADNAAVTDADADAENPRTIPFPGTETDPLGRIGGAIGIDNRTHPPGRIAESPHESSHASPFADLAPETTAMISPDANEKIDTNANSPQSSKTRGGVRPPMIWLSAALLLVLVGGYAVKIYGPGFASLISDQDRDALAQNTPAKSDPAPATATAPATGPATKSAAAAKTLDVLSSAGEAAPAVDFATSASTTPSSPASHAMTPGQPGGGSGNMGMGGLGGGGGSGGGRGGIPAAPAPPRSASPAPGRRSGLALAPAPGLPSLPAQTDGFSIASGGQNRNLSTNGQGQGHRFGLGVKQDGESDKLAVMSREKKGDVTSRNRLEKLTEESRDNLSLSKDAKAKNEAKEPLSAVKPAAPPLPEAEAAGAPANSLADAPAPAPAPVVAVAPVAPVELGENLAQAGEMNRDAFAHINENPFFRVAAEPLSTFSIDVDTASYPQIRRFLSASTMPPPDAVRIEEMVNYFPYNDPEPTGVDPFSINLEVARCPWEPKHRLVRVNLQGKKLDSAKRMSSNLVFLIDVSGSMNEPNKLPLLKSALKLLVDQLGENDRVAIVVYAGSSGLALPSTSCADKAAVINALERLEAGGSTNGGAGIQLAYDTAIRNFREGGINRVILCTDGDFNVGVTSDGDLVRMIEEKRKSRVFLSVIGFGDGNFQDAKMEQLADKGNGNFAYIDTLNEARKVLVSQLSGTLVTIAKDVKIQVEFNPATVAGYRLIGYENRILQHQDFQDDTKDAGEIGAGHAVTAFYQIVPAGGDVPAPPLQPLKYQKPAAAAAAEPKADAKDKDKEKVKPDAAASKELLTVKLRYKAPEGDTSKLIERNVLDDGKDYANASENFRFASSVASFGMLLQKSRHSGNATWGSVIELGAAAQGDDPWGYRREFVDLVKKAQSLTSQPQP